jgi:hypothetical protein
MNTEPLCPRVMRNSSSKYVVRNQPCTGFSIPNGDVNGMTKSRRNHGTTTRQDVKVTLMRRGGDDALLACSEFLNGT